MESRSIGRRRTPRWRRTKYLSSIVGAAALLIALGTGSIFAADPNLPTAEDRTVESSEAAAVEADEPILVIEDPADVKDPADVEDPAEVEDPTIVTLEIGDSEDTTEVEDPAEEVTEVETSDEVPDPAENPGEAPDADDLPDPTEDEAPAEGGEADVEEPAVDAGACAPDIEEPQGDPADVEIPGVTDPDDMGDPPDPADCAPAEAEGGDTEVEDPATEPADCNTGDEIPDPIENPGEAPDADDAPDPTEAEAPAEGADAEGAAETCETADVEDPATDPGACAPDIEEPQGDPADVEVPGVTDPDDMGDPPDPADCAAGEPVPGADAGAEADADDANGSDETNGADDADGADHHATTATSTGSANTVDLPATDTLPSETPTLGVNSSVAPLGLLLIALAGLAGGALSVVRTRR